MSEHAVKSTVTGQTYASKKLTILFRFPQQFANVTKIIYGPVIFILFRNLVAFSRSTLDAKAKLGFPFINASIKSNTTLFIDCAGLIVYSSTHQSLVETKCKRYRTCEFSLINTSRETI